MNCPQKNSSDKPKTELQNKLTHIQKQLDILANQRRQEIAEIDKIIAELDKLPKGADVPPDLLERINSAIERINSAM